MTPATILSGPEGDNPDRPLSDAENTACLIALVNLIERGGGRCGFTRITGTDDGGLDITISYANRWAREIIKAWPSAAGEAEAFARMDEILRPAALQETSPGEVK